MNYMFWLLCALVIVVALLFIVLPLWRSSVRSNDVLRDEVNLEIFRDQITELDTDLRNGLLTQELHEQGKREIQSRLLDEVKSSDESTAQPNSNKKLAIVLAILLPLACVPLYLHLGNYSAALPANEQVVADSSGIIRSDAGISALEKHLKNKQDDANGWFMLASSYIAKQRYSDAVKAYEELIKLVPEEAQVWANYADVYGMANGRSLLHDTVTNALAKALELNPENLSALALSGSAAMGREDFVTAITHFQKLMNQLPPGSQDAMAFEASLQRAQNLLAEQPGGKQKLAELSALNAPKAVDAAKAITGKVSLSVKLAGNVSPSDTVFVLARAAQGPRMPLAVFRKQVKDLPLEFSLDDSMAMQPQLKLSNFDQVIVVARVSKSGTPMAQSGDLEGLSKPVKPGSKGLKIVIDTVVP